MSDLDVLFFIFFGVGGLVLSIKDADGAAGNVTWKSSRLPVVTRAAQLSEAEWATFRRAVALCDIDQALTRLRRRRQALLVAGWIMCFLGIFIALTAIVTRLFGWIDPGNENLQALVGVMDVAGRALITAPVAMWLLFRGRILLLEWRLNTV